MTLWLTNWQWSIGPQLPHSGVEPEAGGKWCLTLAWAGASDTASVEPMGTVPWAETLTGAVQASGTAFQMAWSLQEVQEAVVIVIQTSINNQPGATQRANPSISINPTAIAHLRPAML